MLAATKKEGDAAQSPVATGAAPEEILSPRAVSLTPRRGVLRRASRCSMEVLQEMSEASLSALLSPTILSPRSKKKRRSTFEVRQIARGRDPALRSADPL